MVIKDIESKIKEMISELKSTIKSYGLLNSGNEAEIMTTIFLYKFLNDKYIYNLKKYAERKGISVDEIQNSEKELSKFYNSYSNDVIFKKEDTIQFLISHIRDEDFFAQFDEALIDINNDERNDVFRIEGINGEKQDLFKPLSKLLSNDSDKKNFPKDVFSIISQEKIDFSEAFGEKFDFFASIFEYLAKDYNKDSGANGEYYTPQSCARIIAKIICDIENNGVEIYDPCAGTGSLIMHLAHEIGSSDGINKATIYTQDLSQKSTDFLRINLLLNGLTESLHNVRKGDTLLNPVHYQIEGEETSGLKRFDYIVSNPPFKMDFSKTVNLIEKKFKDTDRFQDGVPEIPKKDVDRMPIYLMFIQHILYSLKENGKAAIVVPKGFITEKNGIAKKIRMRLIDNHWLTGCIVMPPNIFANTGTNVAILFLDKGNKDNKVELIDASGFGKKEKDGKNMRVFLSIKEENEIIDMFKTNTDCGKKVSKCVTYEDIIDKNYSYNPGLYFDVEIIPITVTKEEFNKKISFSKNELANYIHESNRLTEEITALLEEIKYNE